MSECLDNYRKNLKILTEQSGMSVSEIARKTGIDVSVLYKQLSGKAKPKYRSAIAVANVFGCSLDYLLGLSDEYEKREYTPAPPFCDRFNAALKEKGFRAIVSVSIITFAKTARTIGQTAFTSRRSIISLNSRGFSA